MDPEFEKAIIWDIRLVFGELFRGRLAMPDELLFATLFYGHSGDKGYIGQSFTSLSGAIHRKKNNSIGEHRKPR